MATAGTQFPVFNIQLFDIAGTRVFPAAGYLLHQYIAGTTTDQDTFTDDALTVANEHPIELSAAGKCTMYADPDLAYDFVLTTPAGVPVDSWTSSSVPLPLVGDFLELAGGQMLGPLSLEADPTSGLEAATKQYVDAAIVIALATFSADVDAATAAAAAATAAAAAVKPPIYTIASASGGAVTRDVFLSVGTWQVVLETKARITTPSAPSVNVTVTQSADCGTTNVSTSIAIVKAASDTQTTAVSAFAVGSLVVGTAGTFTMSMDAVSLAGQTSQGSMLTVSLQS